LSTTAPLNVTPSNALSVADAYACVRLLSDAVASLPAKVYRRLPAGRVPAGDDQRLVQLLRRPSPGSTSADLFSQIMVSLNLTGDAFIGKYRSGDTVVQLGVLPSDQVQVELRGQRIVYTLDTVHGRTEHSVDDIVHIRGMSLDGLTGMSPVAQCRTALGLNESLRESSRQFFEHGSRPSGILSAPSVSGGREQLEHLRESWNVRHAGVSNMHAVAVLAGDVNFTPISFNADDSQFLQQRELSAREVARIFRVPAHLIDAPTGDSLTYSNASQINRHFLDYSLMPWLVRIERAISNDSDLCPGGSYLQFDLRAFLRPDPDTRSQIYERELNPETGWMTRAEIRELEDLPPEGELDE
jgi:HK97 family phage portal protein